LKIKPSSSVRDFSDAISFYEDDLPSSGIIDEEYERWKGKWVYIRLEK